MKKQFAILATIIAASGFTAFGQDYITIGTAGNKIVYDDFTTPGVGVVAGAGDVDIIALWAPVGTVDDLSSVAGSGYGQAGEAATDQVATNGVTSVASANPLSDISLMLANGWSIAATGGSNIVTTTEGVQGGKTGGQITPVNGETPVEISSTTVSSTGASGGDIEMLFLAYNASAGSYLTATDLGWSNPFLNEIGTSSGDPNATKTQDDFALNQFGVAPVPEPATLVLAGLGGLSMLAFRRRKA